MNLALHQQRVVDEKAELDDKLSRLHAFFGTELYASLDEAERLRLGSQAHHMGAYSDILRDRIAAWTPAG